MNINSIVDTYFTRSDFVYIIVNDRKFKVPSNSNIIYKYAAIGIRGDLWLYETKPEYIDDYGWRIASLCEIYYIGRVSEYGLSKEAIFNVEYMNKVNELKFKNVTKHSVVEINGIDFNIPFNDQVEFKRGAIGPDGAMWLYEDEPFIFQNAGWATNVVSNIIPVGTVSNFGEWKEAIFDVVYK